MARGRLFRSPLLTFGDVEPRGVLCEWTHDLRPLGANPVSEGQTVELHVVVEAATRALGESSRIRFDVLPADPPQELVVSLVGTGAAPPAGEVPTEDRTTVVRSPGAGESVDGVRSAFLREHASDFGDHVLVVAEGAEDPERFHVLTWWTVQRLAARPRTRLQFRVDVDGELRAETTEPLEVSDVPLDARTIRVQLRYEDEAPMADAEFEAAFAGDQRVRMRTGPDGTAEIAMPVGAGEVFRLFLLSYPQRLVMPPAPPPRPGVEPPGPPGPPVPPPDLRPEAVIAFAFDSAFPAPIVFAGLRLVQLKAASAPDTKLMVFGHTDRVGGDAYNVSLSERRARAVLALLLDDREMFDAVATEEGWDTRVHQSMLRGVGCNPGAIDGDVGSMTRAATLSFQREYNLGVYHELAVVDRERATLPEDGNLTPATRAAIRDAYVAVAPHVRADRLADPQFDGCGKAHHVSDRDAENRRAVVAFLSADVDLSGPEPCARYGELVGETREDRRGPRFADHEWLHEETGAVHLSSATAVPDGTPARITVVRCERAVPTPLPDSSGGGEPPSLGPILAELPAEIRGGICYGRWASPDAEVLDPERWLVDHDVGLEIVEPADNEAPPPGDPASSASLLAADALHPPMYVMRAGDSWGVGGPPGQRLDRLRVAPADATEADPVDVSDGLAVLTDGSLVAFVVDRGLVEVTQTGEAVWVALTEHGLDSATAGSA